MPPSLLAELELETSLGAIYKFPDMDAKALQGLFVDGAFLRSESLTLSNVSRAFLQVPSRIVVAARVDGVEVWRRP